MLVITGFAVFSYCYQLGVSDDDLRRLNSMLLIRELDQYLDDLNPLWGWKGPFALVALCILMIVLKKIDEVFALLFPITCKEGGFVYVCMSYLSSNLSYHFESFEI